MSRISRFSFSLLLLLVCWPAWCQKDTVKYDIARTHGLRLGVDISRMVLPLLYDDHRFGMEFSADKQVSKDIFLTAEAGFLKLDSRKETFHYKVNGSYVRVGGDMQIVRFRFPNSRDHVFGGVRYGFSSYKHEASDMVVPDGYWVSAKLPDAPSETCTSHWLEAVAGVKVELARRFYIGATLRGKRQLVKPDDSVLAPVNIPGYGNGKEKHVLSLSYSILYMFGPY